MANTVFIMGAGASYKAGVPLMNDFLDQARGLLVSQRLNENEKKHFERVFRGISSLQKIHSKSSLDINNLESVFATFEMAKRLQKMPDFSTEEIDRLIESIKKLILVTIEKKLIFNIDIDKKIPLEPAPYHLFGGLIENMSFNEFINEDVSIITFNYDLALDYMLFKRNLGPNYCLRSGTNYGDKKVIKLLKLHGSLNWGKIKGTNNIRPYEISEYLKKNYYGDTEKTTLRIGADLLNHASVKYEPDPVIVPPTWNKTEVPKDLLGVWSEAAKVLENADNIFVIGFSMPETDIFFRHLYALGTVGKVPLNRFWVFNPDTTGNVEKRFKDLMGPGAMPRFNYKPVKFSEAIDSLIELYL